MEFIRPEGLISASIFGLLFLSYYRAYQNRQFLRIVLAVVILCWVPAIVRYYYAPHLGSVVDNWILRVSIWGGVLALGVFAFWIHERMFGRKKVSTGDLPDENL